MKKLLVLLVTVVSGHFVFAQDSTGVKGKGMEYKKHFKGDRKARMEMMKDLNLTDAQKSQLKEMRTANKAKRDAIMKDGKLTDDQKKEQLKQLHKSNSESMQSVLTDEQKTKMKATKAKMKEHGHGKKHHQRMKKDSKEVQPATS